MVTYRVSGTGGNSGRDRDGSNTVGLPFLLLSHIHVRHVQKIK